MTDAPQHGPQRTLARTKKGWPGLIWAVPLTAIAIAIAIWLVVRELAAGGVTVSIRFDTAAHAKADSTLVMSPAAVPQLRSRA